MKKSAFHIATLKNTKQSSTVSHEFMLKSGMIRQVTAGIFLWLPLGYKILQKLTQFIQNTLESYDIPTFLSPSLHPAEIWKESNRYDAYGKETLRVRDRHDNELIYSPTAEEVATIIFKNTVSSYKQMPFNINQISWKFRDEIRPRFGVMRSREFLMQDAYSFDIHEDAAKFTYKKIYSAYMKIFQSLDLQAIACKADSGQIGGDFCHEFNVIAKTGESTIFFDKKILNVDRSNFDDVSHIYAVTDDKHDGSTNYEKASAIEVGHIFYIGTKYSEAMNATFTNSDGKQELCHMGCYGIGVSRLLATIIEVHGENVIWPKILQPFDAIILNLEKTLTRAEDIYKKLKPKFDVLLDDLDQTFGEKIANAELTGCRFILVVSAKHGDKIELIDRQDKSSKILSLDAIVAIIQ